MPSANFANSDGWEKILSVDLNAMQAKLREAPRMRTERLKSLAPALSIPLDFRYPQPEAICYHGGEARGGESRPALR